MKVFFFRKPIAPNDILSSDTWQKHQQSVSRANRLDSALNTKHGIQSTVNSWEHLGMNPKSISNKLKQQRDFLALNAYSPRLSKSLMFQWAKEDNAKPIHYAIINNDINLVRSLVEIHGPSVLNSKDDHNNTPLDYAARYNKFGLIRLIVPMGASDYNDSSTIAKFENIENQFIR